jgi:quinol monooxygenase YgiN/mannose-6-phosphate isomerase-like protein (cupin superfamily)
MDKVGRFMRISAKPGQGRALADTLLEVADGLRKTPGCELYVIGRDPADADAINAYEVWSSQEALDGALAAAGEQEDGPRPADVMALVEGDFERIDVRPLGGVGLDTAKDGFELRRLDSFDDYAARFGYGDSGEARFPTDEIGARQTGFSLQSLRPNRRQSFGHRHARAEELYFVLSGSGRANVDGELVELAARDVLRVGPRHARAFEAGEDGLELLVVSARRRGDAEALPGWWGG